MDNPLLVFDINGTLLRRKKKVYPTLETIKFRPHLEKLVKFLHTHNLEYIFWTTALPKDAFQLLKILKEFGFTKSRGVKHFYDCKYFNKKFVKDLRIFKEKSILIDDCVKKSMDGNEILLVSKFVSDCEDSEILRLIEVLHGKINCSCKISKDLYN